jgi:hypothetical protein
MVPIDAIGPQPTFRLILDNAVLRCIRQDVRYGLNLTSNTFNLPRGSKVIDGLFDYIAVPSCLIALFRKAFCRRIFGLATV